MVAAAVHSATVNTPKAAQPVSGAAAAWVIALGIAAIAAYWIYSCQAPTPNAKPSPEAVAPTTVKVGDIGVLRDPQGFEHVVLFVDKDDYNAAAKAAGVDPEGWKEIVRRKATIVPNGTKARKIDFTFLGGSVQVRLMEGPNTGLAGWVAKDCLQLQ